MEKQYVFWGGTLRASGRSAYFERIANDWPRTSLDVIEVDPRAPGGGYLYLPERGVWVPLTHPSCYCLVVWYEITKEGTDEEKIQLRFTEDECDPESQHWPCMVRADPTKLGVTSRVPDLGRSHS